MQAHFKFNNNSVGLNERIDFHKAALIKYNRTEKYQVRVYIYRSSPFMLGTEFEYLLNSEYYIQLAKTQKMWVKKILKVTHVLHFKCQYNY